jgi:hypothetical protein
MFNDMISTWLLSGKRFQKKRDSDTMSSHSRKKRDMNNIKEKFKANKI